MATFLSTSFEIMPLILQRRGRNRNRKKQITTVSRGKFGTLSKIL